ncbi:TlpA disulfide reductase family protein [Dactylosporangium sp. CA-152071]|uniref:TlpA disulfide reductase family protein n=1 Tax=Dactylosporangium sp. CA-152071 TaxID=3239933 RepID=UPI003D8EF659
MTLLYALVAVLTVAVAVDLLLTTAVIRRLRAIEEHRDPGPASVGPPLGSALPAGQVDRITGRTGGPLLLAFFSTTCKYCPDQADRLARRATDLRRDGVQILSVVTTTPGEDVAALATVLRPAGQVVTEPGPGELMAAFGVLGTPTFLYYDDGGILAASGTTVDDLRLPVRP